MSGTKLLYKSAGVLMIKDRIKLNQLVLIQHDFMNGSNLFVRKTVSNTQTRRAGVPTLTLVRL